MVFKIQCSNRVRKTSVVLTSLLLFKCFYSTSLSYAQQPSSLALPTVGSSTLGVQNRNKTERSFSTSLRFESMEYVTTIPDQKELTRSQFASVRLEGEKNINDTNRVLFGVDSFAGTHFTRKSSMFAVNELYVAQFVSSKAVQQEHLTIGRKLYDWSELDRNWNLGLWESRLYSDAIRTESQGLTGFFYYNRGDSGEALFFASPIFIPSQGPEIKEEGGNLSADSRWYRTPSPQFELLGKVNKIDYSLSIPDRLKLASRPGAAAHLKWGKETGGFLKGSVGYKPVNELLFERRNFKRIDTLEVDVTVRPKTTYHQISSVDAGYAFSRAHLSVSYMHEAPETQNAEEDWAIQRLGAIHAYGTHASVILDPELDPWFAQVWSHPTEVALDYAKIEGGEIVDYLANGDKDSILLFDQRLQYSNSVRGQLKTQLGRLFLRPLHVNVSYLYDFDQRGSLMQSELKYDIANNWVGILGADFLGVDDEATAKATHFLNQNRANDRYYAGMGYVF